MKELTLLDEFSLREKYRIERNGKLLSPKKRIEIEINERFLQPKHFFLSNRINVIHSTQFTNKTGACFESLKEHYKIILSHRRNLSRELATRSNSVNYQDADYLITNENDISICVNSQPRIKYLETFKDFVVVIDEFSQVLRHLWSSTCKNDRFKIVSAFSYFLKNNRCILMDADFEQPEFEFIESFLNDGETYTYLKNSYSHGKTINLYETENSGELLELLEDYYKQGSKIIIPCTEKRGTIAIKETLKKINSKRKIKVINSNTPLTKPLNEIIDSIDVLIYSPSYFTGSNIDKGNFDVQFCFFNKVEGIISNDLIQAFQRYRKDIPTFIWIPRRKGNHFNIENKAIELENNSNEKAKLFRELARYDIDETNLIDSVFAPYSTYYFKNLARIKYELSNNTLYTALVQKGFKVINAYETTSLLKETEIVSILKTVKKEEKEKYVRGILKAEEISKTEFEKYCRWEILTEKQEYELIKYLFLKITGYEYFEKVVIEYSGNYEKFSKKFYAFKFLHTDLELLKSIDFEKNYGKSKIDYVYNYHSCIWRRELLSKTPGLDYNGEIIDNSLLEFNQFFEANQKEIYNYLGLKFQNYQGEKTRCKNNFGDFLGQIGQGLCKKTTSIKVDGKKTNVIKYFMDSEKLSFFKKLLDRK